MQNKSETPKCDYCVQDVNLQTNDLHYINCPNNHLFCSECLLPYLELQHEFIECYHCNTKIQLGGKKLEDFRKYNPNICMRHKKQIIETCQTCTQKLCDDCTKNIGHQCILMKSLQSLTDRIVQLQNDKKESFKAAKAKCLEEIKSELIKKFDQMEKDFDENRIPIQIQIWNQEEKPKLEKLKTKGSVLDEEALKQLMKIQDILKQEIEKFSKFEKGLEKNLEQTCFRFSEKFKKFINSIEMDIFTKFDGRDHSTKNRQYERRERSNSSHWSKGKKRNDKSRGPSREPKRLGHSRAPSEEEKTNNLYLAQRHNALQGNQPEPVKIQLDKVRDTIKRVDKIHVEIRKGTDIILTTLLSFKFKSQSLDCKSVMVFNECLEKMGQIEKNSITRVSFNLNGLKAEGIEALSKSLLQLSFLKDLTLKFTRTNEMEIRDFYKIEHTLVKMNDLEILHLDLSGWSWLKNKAMEIIISKYVFKIPKIRKVTLNFSQLKNLSDLGLIQSLDHLRNAPHLETLYIFMQNCSITDACLESITKKYQNIPHFKKLTLNLTGCSEYTQGKKDFGDKLSIIV